MPKVSKADNPVTVTQWVSIGALCCGCEDPHSKPAVKSLGSADDMTSTRTSIDFSEIRSIVLPYSAQNLYRRQQLYFYLSYYTYSAEKAFTGFLCTSQLRT